MFKVLAAAVAFVVSASAQNTTQAERLLSRRYVEGQRWSYRMTGTNNGKTYDVRISGGVKKGSDGHFVDEYAWSDLVTNGAPRALSPTNQAFRAAITLEGGVPFVPPDLSKASQLVAPVLDLLTFYADLFLAMHAGELRQAGDHFRFPNPISSSWADGSDVIIGEDHIDFDVTLTNVDQSSGTASLLVKHIPPQEPKIRLTAEWMRSPVAETPNNWVQVEKSQTGYTASVGKETFDVVLGVSLSDGRILSASMENPVTAVVRECSDAALTRCSDGKPSPTLRHIEMVLISQ